MISLDPTHIYPFVPKSLVDSQASRTTHADKTLTSGTGMGNAFTGWLDPENVAPRELCNEIMEHVAKLKTKADTLVVIGIGGSYLGARAIVDALSSNPECIKYAGQNISAHYHSNLLRQLDLTDYVVNVISKSGTTTEPAIALRLLTEHVTAKYPDELSLRITATTDRTKGALVQLSKTNGYKTFEIDDTIGGRYSVLSPVGLLPIAFAGIDIHELLRGATDMYKLCDQEDIQMNPVHWYAATRNLLMQRGIAIEVLATFEPRLHYFLEWWKQLFGESEGKNGCGLFPASVEYTTDLHSMGQYMQDGRRFVMETFLRIEAGEPDVFVPNGNPMDELSYLKGASLFDVNNAAWQATSQAHGTGGVPNLTLNIPRLDAYNLGALVYFFERACGISGYLMGINPFDQPGVEDYKRGMFSLLGKPGSGGDSTPQAAAPSVQFG